MPRLVGEARAREMVLTGRRVRGPEAYFLGLAERLVDVDVGDVKDADGREEGKKEMKERARERTLQAAVQLAMDICEGAPGAVVAANRAVEGWRDGGESEGREYEGVVRMEDRDEALRAFGEKRKPVFRGV